LFISLVLEFFTRFRGGLFLAGGPKSTSSGRALTKVDTENSECGCPQCRTSSSTAPLWDRICTDLNTLCQRGSNLMTACDDLNVDLLRYLDNDLSEQE
jgi:hypothetical protein